MKTKTLKISESLHQKVKVYCAKNKLKINRWAEKCIEEGMKTHLLGPYVKKINN